MANVTKEMSIGEVLRLNQGTAVSSWNLACTA